MFPRANGSDLVAAREDKGEKPKPASAEQQPLPKAEGCPAAVCARR